MGVRLYWAFLFYSVFPANIQIRLQELANDNHSSLLVVGTLATKKKRFMTMMSVRRGTVRQHAGIVPDVPGAAAVLLIGNRW